MKKGFVERTLLMTEAIVLGSHVIELHHLLIVTVMVVVAGMTVATLVTRQSRMKYGIHFDETHDGTSFSQDDHTTNCAHCAKHDRSRYF